MNATTIPCPVRCEINYKDAIIGICIKSPRTGRELYFDFNNVKHVPKALADRCLIGYRRGGSASFTLEELRQLVQIHASIPKQGLRPQPFGGRFTFAKHRR